MILLVLQFSQIFTNPAQIIFLFPIAAAVIAILGLLTFVEIECNRYVGALDKRLRVITSYTNHEDSPDQQNYLQKTVLPVALNVLSLPTIFIFLWWTSSYLFAIVLLSIIISGIIIFKYNYSLRKAASARFAPKKNRIRILNQAKILFHYISLEISKINHHQSLKNYFLIRSLSKTIPRQLEYRKESCCHLSSRLPEFLYL